MFCSINQTAHFVRSEIKGGSGMTKRMPTARRSPGSKKPVSQTVLVVSNGHPHGKPNGQGTAHRVEEAIRVSGCSAMGEFFRVAKHAFPTGATEPFDMVSELRRFGALQSGNPVPEGYKIPECVRSLADKILESKDRRKCFALLRNLSYRKSGRTPVSPSIEATQFP